MNTGLATRLMSKSLDHPDEVRDAPLAHIEVVHLGSHTLMRATFQPGWRWSEHMRPLVGTDSCQVAHLNYVISGHMHGIMDDGTEAEMAPGDLIDVPPGHDAWVVGDEPVVMLDFSGGDIYAKPQ